MRQKHKALSSLPATPEKACAFVTVVVDIYKT